MSNPEFISVTPDFAKELLASFGPNRSSSKLAVAKYARMMAAGQWYQVGEPICIAPNGTVMNGMHRLKAVIESGATISLPFLTDVDPAAMRVIDTGIGRSYKHLMEMGAEKNSRALAPIVRRMWLWDHGIRYLTGGGVNPNYVELDEYLTAHPELRNVAAVVINKTPPAVGPTTFGVSIALFSRIDGRMADDFIDGWLSGQGLVDGSPILALRERMMRESSARSMTEMKLAIACSAWNAYRARNKVSKIQLPKGKLSSDNYPIPR